MTGFYFKNKKIFDLFLVILLSITFLGFANTCYALEAIDAMITSLLGWIGIMISSVCGYILTVVIGAIINIAGYNNFIDQVQIKEAWIVVRDFCNMFFILILLVIAFATILRIESYNMKKWLPKLLIMAVLINFSRTICGIFIDFSQLVMLTFVNAFSDGGGNFVSFVKIEQFLKIAKDNGSFLKDNSINLSQTVSGIIIAILFMIVATIAMMAILAIFIMRVIMLWIYVVLSPLAFLLSSFPQGQKYASQYWGEFTKYLINGPILAFFIWLSLITMDKLDVSNITTVLVGGNNEILQPASFMSFILAIGFVVGGLIISQQIGGMGASWGASTVRSLSSRGIGAIKGGVKGGAGTLIKWGGRQADMGQQKLQKKVAQKWFGMENYHSKTLNPRLIKKGWDASRAKTMQNYENFGDTPAEKTWTDATDKYWRIGQYIGWKKSDKREAQDQGKIKELGYRQQKLSERKSNLDRFGNADPNTIRASIAKKEKNKEAIIKDYMKKGGLSESEAQEQYDLDVHSVAGIKGEQRENMKNRITKEEEKLTKEQASLAKDTIIGWGTKFHYEKADAGTDDAVKKDMATIKNTSDNDYAVITELLNAVKKNDSTKVVAALNVLAQNNDLNEALKDSRVANLMLKQNGLLEKLVEEGKIKGDIGKIKEGYKRDPVNAAHTQALIQGLMAEVGIDDSLAARHANTIGSSCFAAGNGLGYGMAYGDAGKGGYVFSELETNENGELQAAQSRMDAIVGKFSNMESQAKMRALHPDTFISENFDGGASGISEEGKAVLKSLTGHDLGQISRLRTDVINKIGNSDAAMQDLEDLVKELIADGNEEQADIIKIFGGYIKQKVAGGGIKDAKKLKDVFDGKVDPSGEESDEKESKSATKVKGDPMAPL